MSVFICPVCGGAFRRTERTYSCDNGHCFDISKYGYVNLLMSQKSSAKRHGDDKLMVLSRRDFLEKGYYDRLCGEVACAADKYGGQAPVVLDIGCGEGYYTDAVLRRLEQSGKNPVCGGIDISKDALRYAARRSGDIELALASIFKIPAADESVDVVINMFAPFSASELSRIVKPDGTVIRAFALERHLWGMKTALYENVYENRIESVELEGFSLCERRDIKYDVTVVGEDVMNLFKMTPYYYKTSSEAQRKFEKIDSLDTPLEFCVCVYKKLK